MNKNQSAHAAESARALVTLIAKTASADRRAFESLYRATADRLFGICMRVLGNQAAAEDVLQDVFVSIWRTAAQYDPARSSPWTWLAAIARNRAIDSLRKTSAVLHRPLDAAESISDSGPSPAGYTESIKDNDRLDDCLRQLDARRQSLIRTAFFDAVTYEQLAQRFGAPLGSVKSWIRRGLLQLRACLET